MDENARTNLFISSYVYDFKCIQKSNNQKKNKKKTKNNKQQTNKQTNKQKPKKTPQTNHFRYENISVLTKWKTKNTTLSQQLKFSWVNRGLFTTVTTWIYTIFICIWPHDVHTMIWNALPPPPILIISRCILWVH